MRKFSATLLSAVSLAALGSLAGTAHAQTADQASEAETGGIEPIIVTAQKRVESVQDVPIAVSAFSQDSLLDRGLVGGADLKQAIPNLSFGSTGFGRFNFQIRGIGAQIQGTSVDTGVGIHVNNIPLNDSRLATAELFDIERIEVLRGPQGTLYGRNATGGVVNTITATPKNELMGEITAEYGRYDTRRVRGFVNIPISDTLAVRVAGTYIGRDGTILNIGTGNRVDSRNIWSTRVTAQWQPSDRFRARIMWEHFDQDDSTGGNTKIVCAPLAGPTSIGGVPTNPITQAFLNTGCANNDIRDPANTGVANSLTTIPGLFGLLFGVSPYNAFAGKVVSRDMGRIDSDFDPQFSARNDLVSLDLELKLSDTLTLTSLSSYAHDKFVQTLPVLGGAASVPFLNTPLTPGGFFTDPQLGRGDRVSARYLQNRESKQYSQELRIQSDFDGSLNFNLGGIYIDYDQDGDILALANTTTIASIAVNAGGAGVYIDPLANPDGTGHNYFNNSSPYRLKSAALFGEVYYQLSDTLKATVGLRYTNDRKSQITLPVLLLRPGRGFPDVAPQRVKFEEVTGRFTVDWKPLDDTLVYASYSRGYKGGGFNPGGVAGSGVGPAFAPEFVNAIEVGTKNTFANNRISLNLTGFHYDYKGYQVSKLVNQTVANENIDARLWGVEFEGTAEIARGLILDTKIGYLNTSIQNGASIDTLNPTGGNPALAAVRSIDSGGFGTLCVLPIPVLAGVQSAINAGLAPAPAMASLCTGPFASPFASPGVEAQLKGKELPAAPNWTVSVGGQYSANLGPDWEMTFRADYYWQDSSFARIYNTAADRIAAYDNLNLSYRFSNESSGYDILLFARNLLSQQSVTNIIQQSDSLGGTRIAIGKDRSTYGIAFTKRF